MAIKDKAALKKYFETGKRPKESNFEDLIDSSINKEDANITVENEDIGIGLAYGTSPSAKLHVKGTTQLSGSVNITPTLISGTVSGNKDTYDKKLTGTVDGANGSNTLNGTGTLFNSELSDGQTIKIGDGTCTIDTVKDDTSLTLDSNFSSAITGEDIYVCELIGSGTDFLNEISVGDNVEIDGNIYIVAKGTNATHLRLNRALVKNATEISVYATSDLLNIQNIDSAPVLTIDKEGNVGIGTTPSPEAKLEVVGNTSLGGTLDVTGDTSVSKLVAENIQVGVSGVGKINTSIGDLTLESAGNITLKSAKGTVTVDELIGVDSKIATDIAAEATRTNDKIATDIAAEASRTNNKIATDIAAEATGANDSDYKRDINKPRLNQLPDISNFKNSIKLLFGGVLTALGTLAENIKVVDDEVDEIKDLLLPKIKIGEKKYGGIIFAPGLVCEERSEADSTRLTWSEAITYCDDLSTTFDTTDYRGSFAEEMYTDWRLPTKHELNLMYENLHKKSVGGFEDGSHWSSTEFNTNLAWSQGFNNGRQSSNLKSNYVRVRAVRAF